MSLEATGHQFWRSVLVRLLTRLSFFRSFLVLRKVLWMGMPMPVLPLITLGSRLVWSADLLGFQRLGLFALAVAKKGHLKGRTLWRCVFAAPEMGVGD
jgi:hypothetical protein